MAVALKEKVVQQKSIEQDIAQIVVHDMHWTEEMYFKVADLNHLIELSDGKLVIHDMPIPDHQRTLKKIFRIMDHWVEENNLGEVLFAPMPIRLWEGKIREPDIIFYAQDRLGRIKDKFGEAPNLAVEILSEDSRHRDRIKKMAEYAKAGIEEYWIVDMEGKTIEVYSLANKQYQKYRTFSGGQIVSSLTLKGFEFRVDSIF